MFETVKKINDVKKFDSHIRMGIKIIHKSSFEIYKEKMGVSVIPLIGVIGNLI